MWDSSLEAAEELSVKMLVLVALEPKCLGGSLRMCVNYHTLVIVKFLLLGDVPSKLAPGLHTEGHCGHH